MTAPDRTPPKQESAREAALALIAWRSCEKWTTGPGSCLTNGYAITPFDIHGWCDPCIAWAALRDLPLTTHPAGWCPTCRAVIPHLVATAHRPALVNRPDVITAASWTTRARTT